MENGKLYSLSHFVTAPSGREPDTFLAEEGGPLAVEGVKPPAVVGGVRRSRTGETDGKKNVNIKVNFKVQQKSKGRHRKYGVCPKTPILDKIEDFSHRYIKLTYLHFKPELIAYHSYKLRICRLSSCALDCVAEICTKHVHVTSVPGNLNSVTYSSLNP